ncbi:hypothetical protein C9374_000862 [Naegleria lovaniensis]|uniref:MPN domain-containing protein n=1 Tax=Naegleria lovaniensis TaxID=51637 RepID=A0AA88GSE2_NAELO|nr:uncharacterized protein C9374_000862 [Naegleria lovaniensis]KAG2388012.1 hypothetical protein C9374_000862 [Naegleria lovaniensis]
MSFSSSSEYIHHLITKSEIKFVMKRDPSHSFSYYLKAAEDIIQSANSYKQENKFEESFILFTRFILLFLNIIQKEHVRVREQVIYVERFNNLKKYASYAMDQCELLKKKLIDLYQMSHGNNNCNNNNSSSHTNNNIYSNDHTFKNSQSNTLITTTTMNSHTSHTIKKTSLIPVRIHSQLIQQFIQLAQPHLQRDLEFCGILAGYLVTSSSTSSSSSSRTTSSSTSPITPLYYQISHCFIPKQSCTADSCKALNEITVFNKQEELGLITLGWIHTHPTQDAFLSTIDLKTQYGYQCGLDEAIGIVYAPKAVRTPKMGIFRITDEFSTNQKGVHHGMECIRQRFRENIEWGNQHEPMNGDHQWFEECSHVQLLLNQCHDEEGEEVDSSNLVDLRN